MPALWTLHAVIRSPLAAASGTGEAPGFDLGKISALGTDAWHEKVLASVGEGRHLARKSSAAVGESRFRGGAWDRFTRGHGVV